MHIYEATPRETLSKLTQGIQVKSRKTEIHMTNPKHKNRRDNGDALYVIIIKLAEEMVVLLSMSFLILFLCFFLFMMLMECKPSCSHCCCCCYLLLYLVPVGVLWVFVCLVLLMLHITYQLESKSLKT